MSKILLKNSLVLQAAWIMERFMETFVLLTKRVLSDRRSGGPGQQKPDVSPVWTHSLK